MSEKTTGQVNYLDYLPSIFRGGDEDTAAFLTGFLKIFENVLTGVDAGADVDGKKLQGIAETLNAISTFFHPDTAPEEFLDWLSSWAGLVLKEDWSEAKKRSVIAKIIPLYRMRGTKRGLEEYLNIYIDGNASIKDSLAPLQVGVNSTVGESTVIDGLAPYFFIVDLIVAVAGPDVMRRKIQTVKKIIEMEKPIHTSFRVNPKIPEIQIGVHSTVGIDTLIWENQ